MNRFSAIFTLMLIFLSPGVTMAETSPPGAFQPHQSILDSVQQFLLSHPETRHHDDTRIELGHIDSRLQLPQCELPLQTWLAPGSRPAGKTTVGVRCTAPSPWSLYVPAVITIWTDVYQTARPLPRDHIIAESDVVTIKTELGKLNRGYYTRLEDLVGKQTRRSLARAQILNPGILKTPYWVKRGDQVALVAGGEQFSVRMQGQALANGTEGEQIRVKNLSSDRIVEGIVSGQGLVRVSP